MTDAAATDEPALDALAARALAHHRAHAGAPWLVPDSLPVLYFGDFVAYRNSPQRIVTVGVNPLAR
jgi:hypothetical protein